MKTIGLIGAGHIGSQIARLAVARGYNVVLSNSRGPTVHAARQRSCVETSRPPSDTLISNNGARLPPLVARFTATALAASTLPAPSVAAAGVRRVACLAEAHLPQFA